jgi:serine/threonine-protein kinase
MAADREPARSGREFPEPELFLLDSAVAWESRPGQPAAASGAAPPAGARIGASTLDETEPLRHSRLLSAAVVMAVVYGILFLWNLVSPAPTRLVLTLSLGLRMGIAVVVAGLLAGWPRLTPGQLKGVEYVLFGSLTVLVCVSTYFADLAAIRNGVFASVVANDKNSLLHIFVLMVAYAMFIPNDPRDTARVVIAMAFAPLLSLTLLMQHSASAEVFYQLRSVELAGSNGLYVLIGAGLAIYGAYVLHGLRHELHEARRIGQYQLLKLLGAGGMGEVYLAEHRLLKRPCALKLIRTGEGVNPQAQARFEREVQAAARLTHPNTIEIYDYGHTRDGTFYYVMEYLPGMTLAELVHRFGPLPPGRVIYLLRQACRGLAEAHALGFVHRDLKPANLFLAVRGGEYDFVKILDFGLVKLTRDDGSPELTQDRTVSGTPMFMSPEQATGSRTLDARSDIYALGAIAYYALTGRAPFEGPTAMDVMVGHARDPVAPPSQYRPDLPADLEAVVLRCLEKRPQDRYPNVRALARALAECRCADGWGDGRAEAWWTVTAEVLRAEPEASLTLGAV